MINETSKDNYFKGVFYNLYNHFSKSEVNRIVSADASSVYPGRGEPGVVIDYTITDRQNILNYWASNHIENSSISIHFSGYKLSLYSYSFQSRCTNNGNYPLEWILEGSNDLQNWELLHHKQRDFSIASLCSEGHWKSDVIKTFSS